MNKNLAFVLRTVMNQRGEVAEDLADEIDENDELLEEEDEDVIEINPDELDDEDDDEDDPEEHENEDLVKAREENETLKASLDKRDEEIKKANRNFYGLRKKFESYEAKANEKESKFTDDQIKGLLAEHQDDPNMLFQIMKTISKQEAGSEAKIQVDAANMTQRKGDMDTALLSTWPKAYEDGSEDNQSIQQAKDYFYLQDHPLGDFLAGAATSLMQMDKTLEDTKKEAREKALKVEKNRKKAIKQTSLGSVKRGSGKDALPSKYNSAAKQLNLTKSQAAIYKQLVAKGENATVEV